MSIKEAVEDYLLSCRIRGLSKETMSNKFFALKGFVDYLESIEVKEIEQIKKHDIQKYIENQLKKGLKARTINNRLKNIKVFFDYCEEEEFIKRNPFTRIKMLKEETPRFQVFNDEEIQKILGFYNSKSFKDIKYKTMLYVLTDAGIHVSELRNLRLEDINDNSVFIQKAKGGKQRTVDLSQDYYENEKDLRNDFDCFRKQDFFQDIVGEFEREHDVSIAFLVKNNKIIKLCKRCQEFFISFDTRNRQQICRKQVYVRFASDKFLNINKRSVCEMIQRQQKSIERHRKQLLTESASSKSQ